MPDHVHVILSLGLVLPDMDGLTAPTSLPSLGRVVGTWKSRVTVGYADLVRHRRAPRYVEHMFQKGYFERIIRDTVEMIDISRYIRNNPGNWTNNADEDETEWSVYMPDYHA